MINQEKFELLLSENPGLSERYFIPSFISGLKEETCDEDA